MNFKEIFTEANSFSQVDGELVYEENGSKLSIWWNAIEDEIEFQLLEGEYSSNQDSFENIDGTKSHIKKINKRIKKLSRGVFDKAPEISKSDYKYLYA